MNTLDDRPGARVGLALMLLAVGMCAALFLGIYVGQNWGDLTRPAASATAVTPSSTPDAIVGETFTPTGEASETPATPPASATPEPPPPPEPTEVSWPDPIQGLTASKLGLHALNYVDNDVKEFVNRVHPRVMKALDEVGLLRDVKQVSPDTVTVGRLSTQDVNSDWIQQKDPAAAAAEFINTSLAKYLENPDVDYWEGWNEFSPQKPGDMAWYAGFEAARACQMQALGLRAAVGAFGVGWPGTYEDMQAFLPALEAAWRCGGLFTLHEYASPTFQCGVRQGAQSLIGGAPPVNGPVGLFSLRYRLWYEGLLKPRGLGDLPLVISELGIDGIVSSPECGSPGGSGWKNMENWWLANGLGRSGTEAYVNVLAWYDSQLRADSYVIGATVFTVGAPAESHRWYMFDIHDILMPLAIYEAQLQ